MAVHKGSPPLLCARYYASTLCGLGHFTSLQSSEASSVSIPILQMREQRQTEAHLFKMTLLISGVARSFTQAVWLKASTAEDGTLAPSKLSASPVTSDGEEALPLCPALAHPFSSTSLFVLASNGCGKKLARTQWQQHRFIVLCFQRSAV